MRLINTVLSTTVILLLISCTSQTEVSDKKSLVDFFLPIEPIAPAVSKGTWGGENVLPRDTTNGLEDATMKNWNYWDGSIVKDDNGKYHMYASRWTQTVAHSKGWHHYTTGMHAVSDNICGPYEDKGPTWPNWKNGFGHGVVGMRMHDGRYAIITSQVVPGNVFVSDNPDGPFEHLGEFKVETNGYYPGWGRFNELDDGSLKSGTIGNLSNVMIILRPDNRYMMIARHCVPMISDDGILGPYKMLEERAWWGVEGVPQYKMEDPTVWYSDGLYHIVVNYYGADSTFHITSEDGIHNWKSRGLALSRSKQIFRHKDGTIEDWVTIQRPTVYLEDGEVKAFNFSVIDGKKGIDKPNDNHGSKIMVVPFDGKAFGKYMRSVVEAENRISDATPPPAPWKSTVIGACNSKGNTGYDKIVNTIRMKSSGKQFAGKEDALNYTYQKMQGDISVDVQVLSYELSANDIQSGLMIRTDLNPDSPTLFASITKSKGFKFEKRDKVGANVKSLSSLNIEAPYYLRLEKRGKQVSCFVSSSNRMNWKKVEETTIDWDEEFYVGMAANSVNNQSEAFARFKNIDAHEYGKPRKDEIVYHTFPDTIPASGIIDFEVDIETTQSIDVWVELQNVQTLEKHKVLRERLWKSGKLKLTYDAGTKLNPDNTYWFAIKAIPMHFHDSEHVDAGFKKVFVEKD